MGLKTFKVKCSVCGKITGGRLPRSGHYSGDGTLWYPRRHNFNGDPCEGNIEEGELIDIPERRIGERGPENPSPI